MKKIFLCLMVIVFILCGCKAPPDTTTISAICQTHTDGDNNGKCDECNVSVLVLIDFYAINDLHGKFDDTQNQEGVDELTTFLKKSKISDDNAIFLSSGDMWQGSSESNQTKGLIITEWMNELGFASMTLGNHEYDWGEKYIKENNALANFPFLAINVFDRETNKRIEYAEASRVVECNGVQIGIIGAIGDCYSSISGEFNDGFYFKTGNELTKLVKEESLRLRNKGVDFIVYSLHDGFGSSKNSTSGISDSQLSSYYDVELSNGFVDLVFEGHTHQKYVLSDKYGVYHLQNGGENKGISHVEIAINSANYKSKTKTAEFISTNFYDSLPDDPLIDNLLEKYNEDIKDAYETVGINKEKLSANQIKQLVASLYYNAGYERWGKDYDIVLGGGFISVRSPYNLDAGEVTYSKLQMLLPFDNKIVLCSIQGKYLSSRFFNTSNSDYYIHYDSYGSSVKYNIDYNTTYYIVTDTYCATYAPNHLTILEYYDETTYARDLVAEYFAEVK